MQCIVRDQLMIDNEDIEESTTIEPDLNDPSRITYMYIIYICGMYMGFR